MSEKQKNSKQKVRKRKLAIILSGGGMKCVYGVGALVALAEEYGYPIPDIMIAASGSAGGAAYYLTGQYTKIIATWLSLLSGKRFISYRRRKFVDIDYLVDEVFKKTVTMDFKKLAQTPTKLLFPLTRVTDGKTVFAKVPKTPLLFEYLRAAKAAPIIYGRQVKIGRTSYIDGDFGTNLGDLVRHALTEGAEDIIVIDSDPGIEKNKMRSFILKSLYLEKRWAKETGIVSALKREIKRSPFPRPKNANVIVLSPSSSVPISTVTRRKSVLRRAFNLGFEDVTKNKKLKLLFNDK